MRHALTRSLLIFALTLAASTVSSSAVVLYTYDFPGTPGSGLAANQTNGQPAWATFSDFTRTSGLTQMPGAPANNTFGTETWNQTGTIDTTQYEGFSITAGSGVYLALTSLKFDILLKPSGPTSVEVGLFLNGSSTAYATLDLTATTTDTTYTFNFTPLTGADHVTSATFNFYGWNAAAMGAGIILDNVITNGSVVPEPNAAWFTPLPVTLALYSLGSSLRKNRRQRQLAR